MPSAAWLVALAVFAAGGCVTPRAGSPQTGGAGAATKATSPSPVALPTEEDKTFYALGRLLGRNIAGFMLTPHEFEILEAGLADAALRQTPGRVDLDVYGPKADQLFAARSKQIAVAERARGAVYRSAFAQDDIDAETLRSGVVVRMERTGDGRWPEATDRVTVNYEARLVDGTLFDSTYKSGRPATLPLKDAIPCWTDGIVKVRVGGKARLVCPPDQAYGDKGRPPSVPPGATLIYDVELISVDPPDAAPEPSKSPN